MPTGIYPRLKMIPGAFKKGSEPHNKGIQTIGVKTKVEKFKNKLPIHCQKHGEHLEWRLYSGNNVQCKKCSYEWQKDRRKKYPIKYLLQDARGHAKQKMIDFSLVEKDILDLLYLQDNKCALSGICFDSENNKPSLDRIDPNKGYIIENVQLLTFEVNRMKTNLDQDRFLLLCSAITGMSEKPKKKGK